MSDYVWQPVEESIGPVELEIEYYAHGDSDTATHYDAGHLGDDWVSLGDDVVTTINWGAHEDYRLCRRVPASAGVPVEAIRTLREYGIPLGMTYTAWHKACQQVQDWLDSQPQTGREGNRE